MQRLVIVDEKSGKEIEAWAADFAGNTLAVYIEDPPPIADRPANWAPTFICPDCMRGTLKQGSGMGPRSEVRFTCSYCQFIWKRSDDMQTAIVLESA